MDSLPASVKSVSLNRAGYDQVNIEAVNKRGLWLVSWGDRWLLILLC